MSERPGERRRYMRVGAQVIFCALATAALWMGALGAPTPSGASIARASGRGPCTLLTSGELAQPQVTPRGHASAWLSRATGTDGTLVSISGRGWPANTAVEVTAYSGDAVGGLMYSGNVMQVKTTASGALETPPFRMNTGCGWLGFIQTKTEPATILLVAHTLDETYQIGSVRAPMLFNWLPSPLFNGGKAGEARLEPEQAAPHAGDTLPITSAGWAPGDRITITTLVAAWPFHGADPQQAPPVMTPADPGDVSTTTDSGGSFSLTYRLPDAAPLSNVLLLLHTHDPRYGDVSMYPFESFMLYPRVFPTTLLAERTSLAGGVLTVSGDHWLPNQQIDIEYCRGLTYDFYNRLYCNRDATESLGVVWSDDSGHFFAQVNLPTNARLGDITVQARLDDAFLAEGLDSRPFAAAQRVTIVAPSIALTYAQIHPRRVWVEAHWPYLAASALALLTLLVALAIWLTRRWRGRGGAARAVSGL